MAAFRFGCLLEQIDTISLQLERDIDLLRWYRSDSWWSLETEQGRIRVDDGVLVIVGSLSITKLFLRVTSFLASHGRLKTSILGLLMLSTF